MGRRAAVRTSGALPAIAHPLPGRDPCRPSRAAVATLLELAGQQRHVADAPPRPDGFPNPSKFGAVTLQRTEGGRGEKEEEGTPLLSFFPSRALPPSSFLLQALRHSSHSFWNSGLVERASLRSCRRNCFSLSSILPSAKSISRSQ